VNLFTDDPSGELTLEKLLEYEQLRGEKTTLRKAFAVMLNQSSTDQEHGYAMMVLETAFILLEDMNLGPDPVKCLILKNLSDKGTLSPEVIETDYGKAVRAARHQKIQYQQGKFHRIAVDLVRRYPGTADSPGHEALRYAPPAGL